MPSHATHRAPACRSRLAALALALLLAGCGPARAGAHRDGAPAAAAPEHVAVRIYNGTGQDVEMDCRLGAVTVPLGRVRAGATEVFAIPVRGCRPFNATPTPDYRQRNRGLRIQYVRGGA